ncbi:peptidase C13 [Altererythrobacter salegens]|uniref:Peptidase C13 n=1 Tax=Croceibacterium salegens TaxID=1737568 RepID=A0A6I4SRR1_9SPHN|nr:C13 family peptidase [Croceibacterium salegens]MXO58661.1 peptidase C13 [Croceibacterium salegens]
MKRTLLALATAALAAAAYAQSAPEPVQPPPHTSPWPILGTGATQGLQTASLALGPSLERGRLPQEMLADKRKLDAALGALKPQRKGTVDAYVVAIALDSDPVFAREAREAGRVLAARYDAEGRTVTLAGPDGRSAELARGSIDNLTLTLARVAEVMDPAEDVLVLYTTSHGAPDGLAYHYGDTGFGILSPYRLGSVLAELRMKRRIVLLSACFSGVFLPYLRTDDTVIVTAAAADRTSFGCQADNDWTFFGDALVNIAMRQPQGLRAAATQAQGIIAEWESTYRLDPSQPQVSIGDGVASWLSSLEARMPRKASAPVGIPSINTAIVAPPAQKRR